MKKKNDIPFTEKAYMTTRLDYGYTQEKIVEMLKEIGIQEVRIVQEGNDYVLDFMAKMRKNEAPRMVRINIPYTPELTETLKQKQHKKNVLFRVLFYHLKDKFVAINRGLKEFEEEFLADLVVQEGGQLKRLGDIIVPKYKKMLKDGDVAVFKINGKKDEGNNN
jgi:hypothetical protein